jgi:hypothetical protein
LRRKTSDDALLAERERRVLAWFELHARAPVEGSPEIVHVRQQIEELIEQFAVRCSELKRLVTERDSASS